MEPTPPPGTVKPPVKHEPTIVTVDVVRIADDVVEAKLADGRLGTIKRSEFLHPPSVGSEVEVAVLARQQPKDRVALSRVWARKHRAWEQVEAARAERTPVTVEVKKVVKGGLATDLEGVRAFLPTSQIDETEGAEPSDLVGQSIEVMVIEVERDKDRLVVSRRDALRKARRREMNDRLDSLNPGDRIQGTVSSILDFGAQVDLGAGVRGLVHRSELAWNRFAEIADVVDIGEAVDVIVTEVNKSKRRVGLSIRRLLPDPLDSVEIGQVQDAEITRVVEYGAFAKLVDSGAEGLIHVTRLSEMPGMRPEELVVPGETVRVKVVEIDAKKRRLGLSVIDAMLV